MKNSIKLIKKAKKIAIFSHKSPDPDTIGSSLALYNALIFIGKQVDLYCDDDMQEDCMFLNGYTNYNTIELNNNYDLIIAVDIASETMLGKFDEYFKQNIDKSLRIDHHLSGTNFASHNLVVPFSACSLLIYKLLLKLKVKITPEIATMLYFAICGDTGLFRNNNTDAKTFEVCAKLLNLGADIKKVYSEFFDKKTVSYVKLTSNILLSAEINDDYKFVIMTATKNDFDKFNATGSESIGNLANTYLNCGYNLAVTLKEGDDGIHCSFRSKFEYDCSKLAEVFGGGGHKNASGCLINADLKSAKKQIETEIIKFFNA